MGIGYQFTDRSCIDYELWYLDNVKMGLRGPRTLFDPAESFWSFVGAAQTFGRFASSPFPMIVSSWYGVPHVNFGFAGAGPEYFAGQPAVIEWINRSQRCFLQIMSGRSTSTKLLKAVGFGGVLKFTEGPLKGQRFLAADAYRKLLENYGRAALDRQAQEARENWVSAYRSLIAMIRVPVTGVWVGQEEAGTRPSRGDLLGSFPHLITEDEMRVFDGLGVEVIRAEAVDSGPQLLVDFTTKRPTGVFVADQFPSRPDWSRGFNTYYPTPEMHENISRKVIEHMLRHDGVSGPGTGFTGAEPRAAPKVAAGHIPSPRKSWWAGSKQWATRLRRRIHVTEGGSSIR